MSRILDVCIFDFDGNVIKEGTLESTGRKGISKKPHTTLIKEYFDLKSIPECFVNVNCDGLPFIHMILKYGKYHSTIMPSKILYDSGRIHCYEWFQNGIEKSPSLEIPQMVTFKKIGKGKKRYLVGKRNLTYHINSYIKKMKIDDFDIEYFYAFYLENPELFK